MNFLRQSTIVNRLNQLIYTEEIEEKFGELFVIIILFFCWGLACLPLI
jgi:hypothetical protein